MSEECYHTLDADFWVIADRVRITQQIYELARVSASLADKLNALRAMDTISQSTMDCRLS